MIMFVEPLVFCFLGYCVSLERVGSRTTHKRIALIGTRIGVKFVHSPKYPHVGLLSYNPHFMNKI